MSFDVERARRRLRRTAVWSTLLPALAAFAFGPRHALGVAAGGLLAIVNLEAIGSVTRGLTEARPGAWSWLGLVGLLFRYILLSLALFVIISVWHVNVVALTVGFSMPLFAVVVEAGIAAYRESRAEREIESVDDNAEASHLPGGRADRGRVPPSSRDRTGMARGAPEASPPRRNKRWNS